MVVFRPKNNTHTTMTALDLPPKPPVSGFDVETTLLNFAIVTYTVDPAALRPHIHPRFDLDTIAIPGQSHKALISVVPFIDVDFHFVRLPWFKWHFGQTNYRAYVRDTQTGEHGVWFFGTALDSWTNAVPRYAWQLPWQRTRIAFDCAYDAVAARFERYRMSAEGAWASAELHLTDSGQAPKQLPGFDSLADGLLRLTHPLRGFYYRRDGTLGSYEIWHDQLRPNAGSADRAYFPLLDRLGLVPAHDLSTIHSVLLQHITQFTVYLPPQQL
jgi:hypothetical protein